MHMIINSVLWFFTTFDPVLSVYFYLRYVELSTCPFQFGIRVTQKKKSFYAFNMNNKVLFYLYFVKCISVGRGTKDRGHMLLAKRSLVAHCQYMAYLQMVWLSWVRNSIVWCCWPLFCWYLLQVLSSLCCKFGQNPFFCFIFPCNENEVYRLT